MGVFISLPLESRHWWRTRHLSRKLYLSWLLSQKTSSGDFSGGPVMKNPPAVAGDTSLVPGPGRPHIPRDRWALAPQWLSHAPEGPRSPAGEAPPVREPAAHLESSSRSPRLGRAGSQTQRLGRAKHKPTSSVSTRVPQRLSRRICLMTPSASYASSPLWSLHSAAAGARNPGDSDRWTRSRPVKFCVPSSF